MSDLRLGRFSLFVAIAGFVAVAATFFVPAILVLCAVFTALVGVTGFLSIRTRVARIGLLIALIALPGVAALSYYRYEAVPPSRVIRGRGPVEVRFSPDGGCTEEIVRQIARAKKTVFVQAFSFTTTPITQALVAAHYRGVTVNVILDKRQASSDKYKAATYLYENGIIPTFDKRHTYAHNKVVIIDSQLVITGSMNFSGNGESSNAENLLTLHDSTLAATYTDNWNAHAQHSHPYTRTTETLNSSSDIETEDE